MFGCANVDMSTDTTSFKSNSEVYPIEPTAQLDHPPAPGQPFEHPAPTVSNAIAYARYAVSLNNGSVLASEDPAYIAQHMALDAHTATTYSMLASIASVGAAEYDYDTYFQHIEEESRGLNSNSLPRLGQQIIDGKAKLQTCQDAGLDERNCCLGLLWFEGFREGEDASGDFEERTTSELQRRLSASESGEIHPFRQSGIRAWLSYCGGVISDAPGSLTAFKERYGNYHTSPEWTREFHPLSPAKQAGRRIFRRMMTDGTQVSVAESTRDDCSVLETETIVRPAGRAALFWVFEADGTRGHHAYFPTRTRHEDTVKFAPNTCMGCHYTLDTRQFNIVTPSFEALNLTLFESIDGPVWRDHTHCADPRDTIVQHDVSVRQR